MSKYIDAEKLKRHYAWWDDETKKLFDEIIDLQPAADVAEVRHGRWKPFDLTYGRSIYFCTACNDAAEVPTFNGKPMYKHCPNCGASMQGEEE